MKDIIQAGTNRLFMKKIKSFAAWLSLAEGYFGSGNQEIWKRMSQKGKTQTQPALLPCLNQTALTHRGHTSGAWYCLYCKHSTEKMDVNSKDSV